MHRHRNGPLVSPTDPPSSSLRAVAYYLGPLCVAIPWLNPAALGPSAVIQPWLVSAAVTLILFLQSGTDLTRANIMKGALLATALAAIGDGAPSVLLALAGLAVIALCAAIAAGSQCDGRMTSAIVNGWAIAGVLSSVMALAQYFGLAAYLTPWVNATEMGEAFANLRQRNQFATLTSIALIALLWKQHHGSKGVLPLAAAALLATANAASGSRTGAVEIVLLVTLAFCWKGPLERGSARICVVAIASYACAAYGLPILLHSVSGIAAPNAFIRLASGDGCGSRAVLWSNVLHLIAQKPWWGWGWGELDYAHFATLYPGVRFCDILDNAHNLPLHIAVELGVPVGLLACASFLWWLVRQRPWRETDATRRLAWSVIAVILLHSLLEYPLWYGPFQMAFGFSLGLLACKRKPSTEGLLGAVWRGVFSAVLAVALLYTTWDYHRISQLYTAAEERSVLYRNRSLPRIGDSWLFRDQLAFAELSVTPLTRENAARINALALELLHYSPEPRVIDTAIQSAMWIGREDQALWLLARLRAAFPAEAANAPGAVPSASAPEPKIRD